MNKFGFVKNNDFACLFDNIKTYSGYRIFKKLTVSILAILLLAFVFISGSLLSSSIEKAHAAGPIGTAARYTYGGYGWSTGDYRMGGDRAYCMQPAKSAPNWYSSWSYTSDIRLIGAMYFGYGGPGFDYARKAGWWPSTNERGGAMTTGDYIAATHVLVSYIYGGKAAALFKTNWSYQNWADYWIFNRLYSNIAANANGINPDYKKNNVWISYPPSSNQQHLICADFWIRGGGINIIKRDSATGALMPNIKFNVYKSNDKGAVGAFVKTITTQSSGKWYGYAWTGQFELPSGWYVVRETNAPSGYSNITSGKIWVDNNDWNYVTLYNTQTTSFTATKKFIGAARAGTVLELLQNGKVYRTTTLTTPQNQSYTWTGLPHHDSAGKAYTYSVREKGVSGGFVTVGGVKYKVLQSGNTITNIETTSHTVQKNWSGDTATASAWDYRRPSSVKVQLVRTLGSARTVMGTANLSAANDASYTWSNLDKYNSNGQAYTYAVEELPDNATKKNYVISYAKTATKTTITNTLNKKTITATKKWIRKSALIPTITFNLYNDSNQYITSQQLAIGKTSASFANLPYYDKNGNEMYYTVKETIPSSYDYRALQSSIRTRSSAAFTNISNEKIDIPITKKWLGDPNVEGMPDRPHSIAVELYQNGKPYAAQPSLTLTSSNAVSNNEWSSKFTQLPRYDVNGNEYAYTIKETPVEGWKTAVSGDINSGFLITNTPLVKVKFTKKWVGDFSLIVNEPGKSWSSSPYSWEQFKKITLTVKANKANGDFISYPVNITGTMNSDEWVVYAEIPASDESGNNFVSYDIEESSDLSVVKDPIHPSMVSDYYYAPTISGSIATRDVVVTNTIMGGTTSTLSVGKTWDTTAGGEAQDITVDVMQRKWTPSSEFEANEDTSSADTVLYSFELPDETKTAIDSLFNSGKIPMVSFVANKGNTTVLKYDLSAREYYKRIYIPLSRELMESTALTITVSASTASTSVYNNIDSVIYETSSDDSDSEKYSESIHLSASNDYQAVINDMPVSDSDSDAIYTYYVKEHDLGKLGNGRFIPTYTSSGRGFDKNSGEMIVEFMDCQNPFVGQSASYAYTITNTFVQEYIDIPIRKVWNDDSDIAGIRPNTVQVKLYKHEQGKKSKRDWIEATKADYAYFDSIFLSKDNNWETTLHDVRVLNGDTGEIWEYEIVEEHVAYYDPGVISGNYLRGFTIENNLVLTSVDVNKQWTDLNNTLDTQPHSITVKLFDGNGNTVKDAYGNDRELILNANNGWQGAFAGLPVYTEDSETLVEYTIDEVDIDGYQKRIYPGSIDPVQSFAVLFDDNTLNVYKRSVEGGFPKENERYDGKIVKTVYKDIVNERPNLPADERDAVEEITFVDFGIELADVENWFKNKHYLRYVDNLSNVNMSNVTNFEGMFSGCTLLKSVDLNNLNTGTLTSMRNMFYNCENLETIKFGNLDTSNVTDMSGMFDLCQSLHTIEFDNFNTESATDMNGMFRSCYSLQSVDVSGLATNNVTNMNSMFYGCTSIQTLDLSSFNTSRVTDMSSMFYGDSALKTIYVSNLWNTNAVTSSTNMFSNCSALAGASGTTYASAKKTDKEYARVDTIKTVTTTTPGANYKIQTSKWGSVPGYNNDEHQTWTFSPISSSQPIDVVFSSGCSLEYNDNPHDDATIYMFPDIVLMNNNWNWSWNQHNLSGEKYSHTSGNLTISFSSNSSDNNYKGFEATVSNATLVSTTGGAVCNAISGTPTTTTGVAGYLTLKASNASYSMFSDYKAGILSAEDGLPHAISIFEEKQIDQNSTTPASIQAYVQMKADIDAKQEDELIKAQEETIGDNDSESNDSADAHAITNIVSITKQSLMMNDAPTGASLLSDSGMNNNEPAFVYSPTTYSTQATSTTDIVPWHCPSGYCTCGDYWKWYDCQYHIDANGNLEIKPADGNTSGTMYIIGDRYCQDMTWPWKEYSAYIKTVSFGKGVSCYISNAPYDGAMDYMFCDCKNLISCDFTNLELEQYSGYTYECSFDAMEMFRGCSSLQTINWGTLDWSRCDNMNSLFQNCGFKKINMSNIKVANNCSIDQMFYGCEKLEEISLPSTTCFSSAAALFRNCSSLVKIDLSSYVFSDGASFASMFKGCTKLQEVSFPPNVSSSSLSEMFKDCSNLKKVSISHLTLKYSNMKCRFQSLFQNCSSLERIDMSTWTFPPYSESNGSVSVYSYDSNNMFSGCSSLHEINIPSSLWIKDTQNLDFPTPSSTYVDYQVTGKWVSNSHSAAYTSEQLNEQLKCQSQSKNNIAGLWKWEEESSYIVIFDTNGAAQKIDSQKWYTSESYELPDTSEMYNYGTRFIGWNTKKDGSGSYKSGVFNSSNPLANANDTVTLYAIWQSLTDPIPYTINNTLENRSIHVQKEWVTHNAVLPEYVEVQLYQNGVEYGEPIRLSEDENWEHTFDNLPVYPSNSYKSYEYMVKELPFTADVEKGVFGSEDYNTKITGNALEGFTITNTELLKFDVYKNWDDNNNIEGVRPDSVYINLLKGNEDNKIVVNEVPIKLDADNDWHYEFTGLDWSNDYSVVEVGADGHSSVDTHDGRTAYSPSYYGSAAEGKISIVNSHRRYYKEITLKKEWLDDNDHDGFRADANLNSIDVQILKKISEADGDKSFGQNAATTSAPANYAYGEAVSSDIGVVLQSDLSDYEILKTVTLTPNEDEESAIIDGKPYEDNKWSTVVDNIPIRDEMGTLYEYAFREILPKNIADKYSARTSYTGTNEYTLYNSHENEYRSIDATKMFFNTRESDMPVSVELSVFANDNTEPVKTLTTNAAKEWKVVFDKLPIYDEDGNEITYKVKETPIQGFMCVTTGDQDAGFTLVNYYVPKPLIVEPGEDSEPLLGELGEVIADFNVQKIWNDDGEGRPESVEVSLIRTIPAKAPGEMPKTEFVEDSVAILNEENGWKYQWTDLPAGMIVTAEDGEGQDIISYDYDLVETPVEGYRMGDTNFIAETNTFIIENTKEKDSIVKKHWVDEKDREITDSSQLPQKISATLMNRQHCNATQVSTAAIKNDDGYYEFPVEINKTSSISVRGVLTDVSDIENAYIVVIENGVEQEPIECSIDGFAFDAELGNMSEEDSTFMLVSIDDNGNMTDLKELVSTLWLYGEETIDVISKIIDLNADEDWQTTVSGLDDFDNNGLPQSWYLVEDEVYGWFPGEFSQETENIDGEDVNVMVLTNKRRKSITVYKDWMLTPDSDKQEVSVSLVATVEGEPIVIPNKTVKLSESNDWTSEIEVNAWAKDGKKIEYSLKEDALEGFTVHHVTPASIENNYVAEIANIPSFSINVEKIWSGDQGNEELRTPIEAILVSNASSTFAVKDVSSIENINDELNANVSSLRDIYGKEDENGKFNSALLHVTNDSDDILSFKVKITTGDSNVIEDDTITIMPKSADEADNPGFAEFAFNPSMFMAKDARIELTSLDTTFATERAMRDAMISFTLSIDTSRDVASKILDDTDADHYWKDSFDDLSPVDSLGNVISYQVKECTDLANYSSKISGNAADGFKINNVYGLRNIFVTKIWNDVDDMNKKRPASVRVGLFEVMDIDENGNEVLGSEKAIDTIELSAKNEWEKGKFVHVKARNDDEVDIQYTVREVDENGLPTVIEGYQPGEVERTPDGNFKITNTRNAMINIQATKYWNDGGNPDDERPKSVTFHLLDENNINVATAIVEGGSFEEVWTTTFENLDYAGSDGVPIKYTVIEEGSDKFETKSITGDVKSGFVVTNYIEHKSVPISMPFTGLAGIGAVVFIVGSLLLEIGFAAFSFATRRRKEK